MKCQACNTKIKYHRDGGASCNCGHIDLEQFMFPSDLPAEWKPNRPAILNEMIAHIQTDPVTQSLSDYN